MLQSATKVWVQHVSALRRNKPFICTYEGCTAAFKNKRSLRTHEVEKHGRKKKFTRGAMSDWMEKLAASSSTMLQGARMAQGKAPYMADVASRKLESESKVHTQDDSATSGCSSQQDTGQDLIGAQGKGNALSDAEGKT